MKQVMVVVGTRPEAIKMAPVIEALHRVSNVRSILCVTAQHREMLDQVLRAFDLEPNHDLDLMQPNQGLSSLAAHILAGLEPLLASERPDMVLVHGDTTTTMTAALAAFHARIPVGHVEAGLRTFDKSAPFPEEVNRKLTAVLTDLHFAPTEAAKRNLLREGADSASVYVTGNTIIDSMQRALSLLARHECASRVAADLSARWPALRTLLSCDSRKHLVLVTAHRRESAGVGLNDICEAIRILATTLPIDVVLPVHLNPRVREVVLGHLKGCDAIHIVDPLEYLQFVYLMSLARLIITDSGGVQEEAAAMGVPLLIARDSTERPEAMASGPHQLVGTSTTAIVSHARALLLDDQVHSRMARPTTAFGDGKASDRIAAHVQDYLHSALRRPS
jgi:UDP-N-acetylglucosamine 2-epimerase (non-hydrolysing)